MKLELRHLAPYLPYALGFIHQDETYQLMQLNIKYDQKPMWIEGWNGKDLINVFPEGCQPILRPLSDLTKEIKIDGEKFIPINKLREIYTNRLRFDSDGFYYSINKSVVRGEKHDTYFPFNQLDAYSYLFKWHFDIHNLIKNNLAIDINTLK